MLNDKMNGVFNTIKQVVTRTLPDKYVRFLFNEKINLNDLALQILFECCKYAYDMTAEKRSLRAHMDFPEADDERAKLQRSVRKINDYRMNEYKVRKEQSGIELPGLLPPNMDNIQGKLEGYRFNDLQYWEINNVHDLRIVSAIADNKISSKNFTKQTFIEYAKEYDDVIRNMKKNQKRVQKLWYLLRWQYLYWSGNMLLIFTIKLQLRWTGQAKNILKT